MINYKLLLTDGTLLTLIFTVFVVGTLRWKPRLWLQDFPADIQAMIPPKTQHEKRQTVMLAIPFFVILFGGLGWTAVRYGTEYGPLWTMIHIYLIWQIINLFDLIVIDWFGMLLINPQNPPLPNTAGAKGYRDFTFHFVGYIKGSIMGLAIAPIIATVVWSVIL